MSSKKVKLFSETKKFYGVLKGDKEYGEILKDLKKAWKSFTNRYNYKD